MNPGSLIPEPMHVHMVGTINEVHDRQKDVILVGRGSAKGAVLNIELRRVVEVKRPSTQMNR